MLTYDAINDNYETRRFLCGARWVVIRGLQMLLRDTPALPGFTFGQAKH
jgi:hypothetical protein